MYNLSAQMSVIMYLFYFVLWKNWSLVCSPWNHNGSSASDFSSRTRPVICHRNNSWHSSNMELLYIFITLCIFALPFGNLHLHPCNTWSWNKPSREVVDSPFPEVFLKGMPRPDLSSSLVQRKSLGSTQGSPQWNWMASNKAGAQTGWSNGPY